MITTANEVIERLGIDETQYQRIETLIPEIEQTFLTESKNLFLNKSVVYQSSTMVFTENAITDPYADFIEDYFIAGWVYVTGSVHNDGWHEVSVITESILTTVDNLVAEDSGEFITIQLAKFPIELKSIIADMIGEELGKETKGIKSESLGSHSITYFDSYSPVLQKRINKYRKLFW